MSKNRQEEIGEKLTDAMPEIVENIMNICNKNGIKGQEKNYALKNISGFLKAMSEICDINNFCFSEENSKENISNNKMLRNNILVEINLLPKELKRNLNRLQNIRDYDSKIMLVIFENESDLHEFKVKHEDAKEKYILKTQEDLLQADALAGIKVNGYCFL